MKAQTKTIILNNRGVDEASGIIQGWLESEGISHSNILRIRLTLEELLTAVCVKGEGRIRAELHFRRRFGYCLTTIRYSGDRFDPTAPRENELDGWAAEFLSRTGFVPKWRWRAGQNELLLRVPLKKHRTELIMLACLAAALVIGLLGQFIPEWFRTGLSDYALSYLSNGFLNLLNTFIGLMIFFSITAGICGIGSTRSFGRIGKLMVSRFVILTFIICGALAAAVHLFYPLAAEGSGIRFELNAILEMVFNIIPSNPVDPFLKGNTLQIVFLAAIVGVVLLLTGSETEGIRRLVFQMQTLLTRCVTAVCMFLPIFILASLIMTFWKNGTGVILQFWKPLVLCIVLFILLSAVYLLIVCRRLKVKASVLIP